MDLFPISLNNRDMNTLMNLIEEYGPEVFLSIPGVDNLDDIDEVKRAVSQMGSREMGRFLDRFRESLSEPLTYYGHSREFISRNPNPEVIEEVRALRQAVATLVDLKRRVKRPR